MEVSSLSIEGSWVFTPILRHDDRGVFLEAFKSSVLSEAIGHPFTLAQMNVSVSSAGTVRGIHFALVPPSQAKYIQCVRGRVLDIVVDIRVGSPTYGTWEAVELDDQTRRAVYLSEGLGHGFCALTEDATVNYLCSTPYTPNREFGIHPLDPTLDLPWPDADPVLSPRDAAAPTLAEAEQRGLLPTYAECLAYRASLH